MGQLKSILSLTLVFLALGAVACAQSNDISGNWKTTWLSGGKPNNIVLTDGPTGISGHYFADSGEDCVTSGENNDGKIELRVHCDKFDIKMNGELTANHRNINGDYTAYGNATGKFRMDK